MAAGDLTHEPRVLSILVAALGGQGGGLLTEWIVEAAHHAGLPVQSTSIPGVAQRTGATTYYIEMLSEPAPPGAGDPPFGLHPTPGDLDVLIGLELMETCRAIEKDYVSPDRTVLITSTSRVYAIAEKSAAGDGIVPIERLHEAVQQASRRCIAFDPESAGRDANAMALGALAASGVLPLSAGSFETAIRSGGVAVERNLAAFQAGVSAGDAPPARATQSGPAPAPAGPLDAAIAREFDGALRITLIHAAARLIDYQDQAYASRFLERVRGLRDAGADAALTERFARRLAVWMTYEDAIRVADLKTRRARFDAVRAEQASSRRHIVKVVDYLKPDLDELYLLLPAGIARPVARWAESRWPERRPTIEQHVTTTSITGFVRVWLLSRLRFLRPRSLRFEREWQLISRWDAAVRAALPKSARLAGEIVELAALVRGYGDVRRRMTDAFTHLLAEHVEPALHGAASGEAYEIAAVTVRAHRFRLLDQPDPAALPPVRGRLLPMVKP